MTEDTFATLVRTYRKNMGWTQEQLSEHWSYSFETISAWERGKRTPSNQEIPRLAKFLEISPEEMSEIVVNSRVKSSKNTSATTRQQSSKWKANFETWEEFQHIYRTRTEFNRDFSYPQMFENAQTILAAGISLNSISLTHGREDLVKAVLERNCRVQLCFLDPDGKKCTEREEEESYKIGSLAYLNRTNMQIIKGAINIIEHQCPERSNNIEIRVYDLTPRFNIYIVDSKVITVQSYAYGRGEDTPILLLQKKTNGGLFDFYASAAQHILDHSTDVTQTFL